MPELPEVETIKQGLERQIVGRSILDVEAFDRLVLGSPKNEFIRRLKNKKVAAVSRRGKAIILTLEPKAFLVVQLAMTGQLIYGQKSSGSKVTLRLSNGKYLHYNDARRFGRLHVLKELGELKFLRTLGPEPLGKDFNVQWLTGRLRARKSPIKSLLMNQFFVAGIGNIYASEILFRAGINPTRPAKSLKEKEIKNLHQKTQEILKEAIRLRGSSIDTYRDIYGKKGNFLKRIQVYGRQDEVCHRCGNTIQAIVQSGRSTFFCCRCQI